MRGRGPNLSPKVNPAAATYRGRGAISGLIRTLGKVARAQVRGSQYIGPLVALLEGGTLRGKIGEVVRVHMVLYIVERSR